MSKDTTEQRFAAYDKEMEGIRNALRGLREELNQAVQLLGKMSLEAEVVNANTKRLQLEMEKVYDYLNKNRITP